MVLPEDAVLHAAPIVSVWLVSSGSAGGRLDG